MSGREWLYTPQDLKQMQEFPLERKIQIAQTRIIEWISKNQSNVFVSFSGGKDSTVLLDLVRRVERSIPAVFSNTGLEFPEIRKFALSHENVIEVRPEIPFGQVLTKYGYPLISKDVSQTIQQARSPASGISVRKKLMLLGKCYYKKPNGEMGLSRYNCPQYLEICNLPIKISQQCCLVMKERPMDKWQRKNKRLPFVGTMASESMRRKAAWQHLGCNAFDSDRPRSAPLSIWTEQDVLQYVLKFGIEICSVYGDIVPVFSKTKGGTSESPCLRCTGRQRTGCIFCCYGAHIKDIGDSRFQALAKSHPKLYDYCMRGGQWIDNPKYDPSMPKWNATVPEWYNWNPKKIWVPNERGLGYKVMFDMVNSVMGKDFYRYD